MKSQLKALSLKRIVKQSSNRLYFIDALRAFAILMMLQGHFISGLLASEWQQTTQPLYLFWKYCRGFTAPIFFTITGWVFYLLLLQNPMQGWKNPRIKRGWKRAVELLLWGYLLRLNLPALFTGTLNPSFLLPDVLQIIGLSLAFIMLCYLGFYRNKIILATALGSVGLLIFCLEPLYGKLTFPQLPTFLSAYLTKANGGVFYLLPWMSYVCIGAVLGVLFHKNNFSSKALNQIASGFLVIGILMIFTSSSFFIFLSKQLGLELFRKIAYNNFLFIRLGDVSVLIAFFMGIRKLLKNSLWIFIGSKTLSIYIVHYFILYGSLTGMGIYKYYARQLSPWQALVGSVLFMLLCVGTVRFYPALKKQFTRVKRGLP